LTYFSPKQRIATAHFHKIISVDTTILRCPKQYIIGVNHHHIQPMIAVNAQPKKTLASFVIARNTFLWEARAMASLQPYALSRLRLFLKSPERRDLLLN